MSGDRKSEASAFARAPKRASLKNFNATDLVSGVASPLKGSTLRSNMLLLNLALTYDAGKSDRASENDDVPLLVSVVLRSGLDTSDSHKLDVPLVTRLDLNALKGRTFGVVRGPSATILTSDCYLAAIVESASAIVCARALRIVSEVLIAKALSPADVRDSTPAPAPALKAKRTPVVLGESKGPAAVARPLSARASAPAQSAPKPRPLKNKKPKTNVSAAKHERSRSLSSDKTQNKPVHGMRMGFPPSPPMPRVAAAAPEVVEFRASPFASIACACGGGGGGGGAAF